MVPPWTAWKLPFGRQNPLLKRWEESPCRKTKSDWSEPRHGALSPPPLLATLAPNLRPPSQAWPRSPAFPSLLAAAGWPASTGKHRVSHAGPCCAPRALRSDFSCNKDCGSAPSLLAGRSATPPPTHLRSVQNYAGGFRLSSAFKCQF